MRNVLGAIIVTLLTSGASTADERLDVWPWFYNLITQGGHTITWLAPDGVFDVGVYFADGFYSGRYSMRYENLCFDGEWWVNNIKNTLHFADPIIDPAGSIGYELYRTQERVYYLQPEDVVRVNGIEFHPEEARMKLVAYTSLANGC